MSKILNQKGNVHIGAMHLRENGIIDIMKQLYRNCFLLWTEKDMYAEKIKKSKGGSGTSCVLGEGEFHETSTEKGLMAIVIESEELEKGVLMKEVGKFDDKGV